MRDVHVDPDLSAYLDDELAPADRARVEAHLATCDRCPRRLAELRATASLITALPHSRASRSLVPNVTRRLTWLRPLRSLSMVASGAFLFAFLLTAVARSGTGLGGAGAPTAAQVAAPVASVAREAGSAPQASAATGAAAPAATALPAPALGAAQSPVQRSTTGATAAPSALFDAQKSVGSSPPAPDLANVPPSDRAQDAALARSVVRESSPSPLLEPLLWLALAIVAAVLALIAHTRLRTN